MSDSAGAILLTRPLDRSGQLVVRLRALGVRVHHCPTIATQPIAGAAANLASALLEPAGRPIDWLVVTSAAGAAIAVEALARIAGGGGPGQEAAALRLAAVGPATAAALSEAGHHVDCVPAVARGAAIADALTATGDLTGLRIVLARAAIAAADLPEALRRAGADVDDRAVYRTVEGPPAASGAVRVALADPDLSAIVVASGSALRGLVRCAAGPDGSSLRDRLDRVPLVSIGPSTSDAVRAAGLVVAAEASRPDDEALLDAVSPFLSTLARSSPR